MVCFVYNKREKNNNACNQIECRVFFPYLTKTRGEHNKTIDLLRKGKDWYIAIPIQVSSELDFEKKHKSIKIDFKEYTPIGVDLGLRHLAVLSEPGEKAILFW